MSYWLYIFKGIHILTTFRPEIFDEYTRRQYVAKAPHRNPFGVEEEPAKICRFRCLYKGSFGNNQDMCSTYALVQIRVLQQLTQWTMGNPDRIREKMEEQKDHEQTIWVCPISALSYMLIPNMSGSELSLLDGTRDDRTYFVLDDNRVYRRTDPPSAPPPAAKPKTNSKKAKAARRASKRRKAAERSVESETELAEDVDVGDDSIVEKEDDGLGGMKWECLAVTFGEISSFVASLEKSRDPTRGFYATNI